MPYNIPESFATPGDRKMDETPGMYVIEKLRELQATDPADTGRQAYLKGKPDWNNVLGLYGAFKNQFGREPSQAEINQLAPFYMNSITEGNSVLQNYKEQQDDTPENRRMKVEEQAKPYRDAATNLIKSTLGRDASDAEVAHFAALKAQGFDDYELGQALQQLPEYTEKQDAAARDKLRGELSSADSTFFNDKVMPGVQANFARQGRSLDSSAFGAQLANAAKDIGTERETYLAGIGRSDYENRRQQAIQTYMGNLQRNYGQQDYSQARKDQLEDVYRKRGFEQSDYSVQKAAYDEYLRNAGKRKTTGLGQGIGSLIGTAAGAYFGGPTGAMVGSQAGGSIGGMFDSY
jgi:hypothetical protein